MRAKIRIKNNVQDVGLRSIATAVLIENGIKKAKVLNDEKDKTVVNIILDEDEKTLNNIVKALNRELKNREEYPQLPEQFTVSNWEKTDSNPETLPDLSTYVSDALQLRQMSKFVGVGNCMTKEMKGMREDMKESFTIIGSKLDKLPENMAKEIANLKKIGLL